MTHIEQELSELKRDLIRMGEHVYVQLERGKESLLRLDKQLAEQIILSEKRVNAYELKLDRDCENFLARFQPVAVDLRCALAVLKINYNLERIGDLAEGMARFVLETDKNFDTDLLEVTRLNEMYDEGIHMLREALDAFEQEDSRAAKAVFVRDEILDEINAQSSQVIAKYIRTHPEQIEQAIYVLSVIRKLERLGDQVKNISEETVFFIEAVVLKHRKKTY
jgi:phosphate transport system protein